MTKKRLAQLTLLLALSTFATNVATATPMTDFKKGQGQIDAGVWFPKSNTTINIPSQPEPEPEPEMAPRMAVSRAIHPERPPMSIDLNSKANFHGGVTYSFADRWAIQYVHHSMNSSEDKPAPTPDIAAPRMPANYQQTAKKITADTNEINLLYSVHPNVAVFVGLNRFHVDGSLGWGYPALKNSTANIFQGGIVAQAPIAPKVNVHALAAIGTKKLRTYEVGVGYDFARDWNFNVGYRYTKADVAKFDLDEPISISSSFKGLKIGLAYKFGKPAPSKPAVVVKEVQPEKVIVPEKIVLRGINFDFDEYVIRQDSYPILNTFVNVAKNNPSKNFLMIGHTDSIGTDEYNMNLSRERVNSAKNYAVSQGVAAARMQTAWKGESEPVATNATPEGRELNRRIEIFVLP